MNEHGFTKSESNQINNYLKLPAIEIEPIKHSIGHIYHMLCPSYKVKVEDVEDIHVNRSRKEILFRLEDRQEIVVIKKKNIKLNTIDKDLLFFDDTGQYKWLKHRLLDQFKKLYLKGELSQHADDIQISWRYQFCFKTSEKDSFGKVIIDGLRPPQIGGLYAIGAHWSINNDIATIVMPTGTGKTETILATLVTLIRGKLLIVVPSTILRDQTLIKLKNLGLLRELGNIPSNTPNPIVGVIEKKPRSKEDLDVFQMCNVVVSTISALSGIDPVLINNIADQVKTLVIDEAHHVPAKSWSELRKAFEGGRILQFTATPYRLDGKLIDGKKIFEYPLKQAQLDGYFCKINFEGIFEIDPEKIDRTIAATAIDKLRLDLANGKDHLMMARCNNINRASEVLSIYKELSPDFNPLIIHSILQNNQEKINSIRQRESRIVVCVDMLGEGFDLPQLKIAAVHDTHKSLSVLLQFIGRFTRTAGDKIGDATVIANTADQQFATALERLYCEDADWNILLSEFSSEASKTHSELIKFLDESEVIRKEKYDITKEISNKILRPALSAIVYEANEFKPNEFFKGLPKKMRLSRVWLNRLSKTLYFVAKIEPPVDWTRSKEIRDNQWHLFILHYMDDLKLLFLFSSDKKSPYEELAKNVGADKVLQGDTIFRCLGGINRLTFQNVGVKKVGRRNLRFALYTGANVAEALSLSEKQGSVKSNLSGMGWENCEYVTIGCSYKGRIWERKTGTIPEFNNWCTHIGKKLRDNSISTNDIIENVLIPQEVFTLPDKIPLCIDWPIEILRQAEEKVVLIKNYREISLDLVSIRIVDYNAKTSKLKFQIFSNKESWKELILSIDQNGYQIINSSTEEVNIRIGKIKLPIETYLYNYPPLVRFVDLSELDGQILVSPKNLAEYEIPEERFEVWDWVDVDFKIESYWKNRIERKNSIQWTVAKHFINGGYDIVFDDDGAGEAADLICIKEEKEIIRLSLVHCKFSSGSEAGTRVKDVVEVSSQAIRSVKWKIKFRDLCKHILNRELKLARGEGRSRFLCGNSYNLNILLKNCRFKEVKTEIVIAQPGLSVSNLSNDQKLVLAATFSYLKETIGVDLDVICSS